MSKVYSTDLQNVKSLQTFLMETKKRSNLLRVFGYVEALLDAEQGFFEELESRKLNFFFHFRLGKITDLKEYI
jgi:hypothetical protein